MSACIIEMPHRASRSQTVGASKFRTEFICIRFEPLGHFARPCAEVCAISIHIHRLIICGAREAIFTDDRFRLTNGRRYFRGGLHYNLTCHPMCACVYASVLGWGTPNWVVAACVRVIIIILVWDSVWRPNHTSTAVIGTEVCTIVPSRF